MAKVIKKISKVTSSDVNFIKKDGYKKFKSKKTNNDAVTLIRSGNGYRTRLSTTIYDTLGKPESVDILFHDNNTIMICTAPDGNGSFSIMQGRIIYDTELAEQIMELNPDVDFTAKGSTHCGSVLQSQTSEDGVTEVIIKF